MTAPASSSMSTTTTLPMPGSDALQTTRPASRRRLVICELGRPLDPGRGNARDLQDIRDGKLRCRFDRHRSPQPTYELPYQGHRQSLIGSSRRLRSILAAYFECNPSHHARIQKRRRFSDHSRSLKGPVISPTSVVGAKGVIGHGVDDAHHVPHQRWSNRGRVTCVATGSRAVFVGTLRAEAFEPVAGLVKQWVIKKGMETVVKKALRKSLGID